MLKTIVVPHQELWQRAAAAHLWGIGITHDLRGRSANAVTRKSASGRSRGKCVDQIACSQPERVAIQRVGVGCRWNNIQLYRRREGAFVARFVSISRPGGITRSGVVLRSTHHIRPGYPRRCLRKAPWSGTIRRRQFNAHHQKS